MGYRPDSSGYLPCFAACVLAISGLGFAWPAAGGEGPNAHPDYRRAQELLEHGVLLEAVHGLEAYLQDEPDDMAARLQAAGLRFNMGFDRVAADHAGWIYSRDPENQEARRMLIRIRSRMSRDLDRSDPESVLYLARLARLLGNVDRAIHYYLRHFELEDDAEVRLELARAYVWWDRPEEAVPAYGDYLHRQPEDGRARWELGRLFNAMGFHDEAAGELRGAARTFPDPAVTLDLARALLWGGRHDEALDRLQEVLHLQPGNVDAQFLMATVHHEQHRHQAAHAHYQRVLALQPEHSDAALRLAEYAWERLLEMERLQTLLRERPDDLESRKALIRIYRDRNRHAEALREVENLLWTAPDDEEAIAWKDDIQAPVRRQVEARVRALNEMQRESQETRIRRYMAWTRHHTSDLLAQRRLADALMQAGRYKEAVVIYRDLAALAPNDEINRESLQYAERRARSGIKINRDEEGNTAWPGN